MDNWRKCFDCGEAVPTGVHNRNAKENQIAEQSKRQAPCLESPNQTTVSSHGTQIALLSDRRRTFAPR
jgi:hypothetical protein